MLPFELDVLPLPGRWSPTSLMALCVASWLPHLIPVPGELSELPPFPEGRAVDENASKGTLACNEAGRQKGNFL